MKQNEKHAPPQESAAWFLNGFHRFLRPYLRRHFHAIAIDRSSRPQVTFASDASVIVYANHPSWWDPLIAHYLHRTLFPNRHFFAPIDAEALQQYRVFGKLGFFGVEMSSVSGAANFLRDSASILERSDAAIWITPEGRFADARDHHAQLMPGLGHLCRKHKNTIVLPLALEYAFWDERLPVCLVKMGDPIQACDHPNDSKLDWRHRLTTGLRGTQHDLSKLAISRSSDGFENLLSGTKGSGWFYDSCRRIKAAVTGTDYRAGHGDQFQ